MDPDADPSSEDYRKVRAVIDRAIADLKRLGAEVVDPVAIGDLNLRIKTLYDDDVYETEEATNRYLKDHANAPAKTFREILLSGKVVPQRAKALMDNIGKSTTDAGYLRVVTSKEEMRRQILKLMADNRLDALVYATFDHQATPIADDVLTNPDTKDAYARGQNRYLATLLAWPALTVPAGFTVDRLPVGIEFMGRAFSEPLLIGAAYAFEQGTHHRAPPSSTPALAGEP
jgi:Asp-tRNA(Asn)/Glu-tRNA(Gln) amidotransferase A subunit family amidase